MALLPAQGRSGAIQFTQPPTDDDLVLLNQFHRARLSLKTWQARQSDLRQFQYWCSAHTIVPAQVTCADLCLWLAHMASDGRPNRLRHNAHDGTSVLYEGSALSLRSIRRRLSSVKWWLGELERQPNPAADTLVQDQLAGIVRLANGKPRRAKGVESPQLAELLSPASDEDFIGLRDKTLLAVGFAGALRISDLANLECDGVELHRAGALLGLAQRKRSQGYTKVRIVAGKDPRRCPVALLRRYLEQLGQGLDLPLSQLSGPLFRRANRNRLPTGHGLHPTSIARVIARCGRDAGLEGISGHSLRRGFIDSALKAGAPISEVMKVSGHKDPKTLMIYLDDLASFDAHPGHGLY